VEFGGGGLLMASGAPPTGRRLYLITGTMMLGIFLSSLEGTVVATAMPTIVAQLGGLEYYAWVFSIYMLTSTTVMPIFGKLSDIYGRRPIFIVAMGTFLIGSLLCSLAQTMPQLIVFRAVQGLGGGGLLPLAFTVIGDIYTLERRAKIQGLFSTIWAVSGILGPLGGGYLVETVSWRSVFFINVPVVVLATLLMLVIWRDVAPRAPGRVDYLGSALLSGAVIVLLLALFELNDGRGWAEARFLALIGTFVALLIALAWVERRAPNPMLPLALFRDKVFGVAVVHGFLAGVAVFGSWVFIPLFVQAVLGLSPTVAGASIMPQSLTWVAASIIGTRLMTRVGFRSMILVGMASTVVGLLGMAFLQPDTPLWVVLVLSGLQGVGMGLTLPPFLIVVQSSVARPVMGTATSNLQFSRNIGGTVGVSVMGVLLALQLTQGLIAQGLSPDALSLGQLLDAETAAQMASTILQVRGALTAGIRDVFLAAGLAAIGAWVVSLFAPRGRLGEAARPASEPVAAAQSVPAGEQG
jgi:EmrB/QacA subfamily drug resistance transporter